MKFLVKAAVVAAALAASAAASADTFDFTYTFTDGQELTGSFTGTASGSGSTLSASNISNLAVLFNGVAFSGGASTSLILNSWNTGSEAFTAPSASTTIYANSALNNFGISDVDQSVNGNPDYEFNFINDTNPAVGSQVVAFNALAADSYNPTGPQFDLDSANGTFTLTDAGPSPVPVPAALPLLLSGLGLFGFSRRRRAA